VVFGLLQHRLVGLFEEQSRSVLVEECGHAGDCVGGSLVVRLVEEELPVLQEPLQPDRDLRHRRIWQSLSIPASAREVIAGKLQRLTSTFHCDRCSKGTAALTS